MKAKRITFHTMDNEDKMRLGEAIHETLSGQDDYIENRIILNVDRDCEVELYIFEDVSCPVIEICDLRNSEDETLSKEEG